MTTETVNSRPTLERITEARSWLRKGIHTKELVDATMANIAQVRGQEVANEIRAEMRRQWAVRRQWWGEGCPE